MADFPQKFHAYILSTYDDVLSTFQIDVGICGDARLAAEAISNLLESKNSKPECLGNAEKRVADAAKIRKEWEVNTLQQF